MSSPTGWIETVLGEVSTYISRGRSPKYAERSPIAVANQRTVRWSGVDRRWLKFVDPSTSNQWSSDHDLQNGDILWNSTGTGTIGRAALYKSIEGFDRVVADSHITVVRAADGVLPEYLFSLIRSPNVQSVIGEMQSGSTNQVELSRKAVSETRVPLPPTGEQRRIIAKLDALTARITRARAEIARVPTLAAKLRAAALARAFRGDFAQSAVGHQPCDRWIDSTFYGPRFGKEEYVTSGIPTARTTDFHSDGTMSLDDAPRVLCSDRDFAKWGLEDGDLVVTRTGSIGKCAVYTAELGKVLPSAYLIRVRFAADILPRFAWMMFASPQGQEHLGVNSRAVTQPNINATAIRSLPFPKIDLPDQRATIEAVDRIHARADRLEAEAARAMRLLDRLEAAILAKAFRGELVPQDAADEPATALLDRIRQSRAAATKPKRERSARMPAPAQRVRKRPKSR